MRDYLVTWEISITANSPEEAARIAQATQRDPDSMATIFDIFDEEGNVHRVDLLADLG